MSFVVILGAYEFDSVWRSLSRWLGKRQLSLSLASSLSWGLTGGPGSIFPFHTCIRQWEAELRLKTNSQERRVKM